MKLLINTSEEQIILDSGESYSIDELNEFLKVHLLDHYKIYVQSPIVGCINTKVAEEFTEKYRKLMQENKGNFSCRVTREINGYPEINTQSPTCQTTGGSHSIYEFASKGQHDLNLPESTTDKQD